MNICKRFTITGRVQGVWFRANTREEAKKLNLTGWVKNMPDRSVQVLACGEEKQMDVFEKWLHKGPILAKVKQVSVEIINHQTFSGFEYAE